MTRDLSNLHIYSDPRIVQFYVDLEGIVPGEKYLFEKYFRDGMSVLDIGVGGGRTTPYFAATAKRYIGIDYSEMMVQACRRKYANVEFETMNATDLSGLDDGDFDLALFAYNGIDSLASDAARAQCLSEARRVLKPGAIFIFSSHNARGGIPRPRLQGAGLWRKLWRIGGALRLYVKLKAHLMRSGVFFRGQGYSLYSAHGGLLNYACTPAVMTKEAIGAGFEVVEIVDAHLPHSGATPAALWYYYVLAKPKPSSGEPTAPATPGQRYPVDRKRPDALGRNLLFSKTIRRALH
ncbi:class I SAM-dependent methyltransferase [Mycolicibacterium brisbanense]